MKVYELFGEITKWCKGSEAENDNGIACQVTDPRAVQWCSIGGIQKCYETKECRDKAIMAIGKAIAKKSGLEQPETIADSVDVIVVWNDDKERRAEEVVELFTEENV